MTSTAEGAAQAALPEKWLMIEAVRLLHPGRVVELRVLNVDGRGATASGYFDQPLKLAEAALRYGGRAEGVYITLNPLPPDLLGRSNNTLREWAKTTTSDNEVRRRAYLPIDLDPTRPSGISSSEAEHQAALGQARKVRAWLAERRWYSPLFADSGNGAHLLYAIDLPNDAESADLLKRCLAALAGRFDTPQVTLDRSVYNAARIWKLYGSVARKGAHLPERPHRLARLIETPDPLGLVTRAQLEALAALASTEAGAARRTLPLEAPPSLAANGVRGVTEPDLLAWLAEHGAAVWQTKREGERTLYLLESCPFEPGHRRKAFVSLADTGALGFRCFAASCAAYHWQELRAIWGFVHPLTASAEAGETREPSGAAGPEESVRVVSSDARSGDVSRQALWPEPPEEAVYRGLAGEIVRVFEPQTEADPLAVLVQLLTAFGAALGPGPHFMVGEKRHEPRLFTVIVGQSAKARKGDAWHIVRALFAETRLGPRLLTSLSSGEGLIRQVRDDVTRRLPIKGQPGRYAEEIVEVGEPDKRLLMTLTEMAEAFAVLRRDGNTLSAILRDAWDQGALVVATKLDAMRATGAYLAFIGHITVEELRHELTGLQAANGFANRFLWFAVRRGRVLPRPRPLPQGERLRLAGRLAEAITRARQIGEVDFTPEAELGWTRIYEQLSEGRDGLAGALLSRGEAQTLRLALLYALLDGSAAIDREHLMAAVALWEYAERSVEYLFGGRAGDTLAEKIAAALREQGELTRSQIWGVAGTHARAADITRALESLEQQGKVIRGARPPGPQGGRPQEVWRFQQDDPQLVRS
jgi:hypothetical protein